MKRITTLLILLGAGHYANGAMFYTIGTDSSGTFVEGGYTGTGGTVQPNGGGGNTGETVVVQGFNHGTFDLGRTAVEFNGFASLSGHTVSNTPSALGASVTITLNGVGATADFAMVHQTGILGKPVIANMQNVTSFYVEWTWDEPIAAPIAGPLDLGPFLTGLANITSVPLEVEMEILGLAHTLDGVTATAGLPTGAVGVDMSNNEAPNVWGSGTTSSYTLSTGGVWQGINGFDLTGGTHTGVFPDPSRLNDGIIQDVEMVYATGFKAHVEASSGDPLPAGSRFIFSTNGNQWSDTLAVIESIPEPSTSLLVGLGGGLTLLHRKR